MFKIGDFVKLRATGDLTRGFVASREAVAVVVATVGKNPLNVVYPNTERETFTLTWIRNTTMGASQQQDGVYDQKDFEKIKIIEKPPFGIGDVVKFSYPLDSHEMKARFIVVMTDWHRKTVSDEYIDSIKSCLDDDDDAEAAFYVENPTYVYVLPIGYEPGAMCDGYKPANLVRVASAGEVQNLLINPTLKDV